MREIIGAILAVSDKESIWQRGSAPVQVMTTENDDGVSSRNTKLLRLWLEEEESE